MLPEILQKYDIILASKSPRRQELLKNAGIPFRVLTRDIDESYPPGLDGREIAVYLAGQKAEAFKDEMVHDNTIIITADTVVWHEDVNLGKPVDYAEAMKMLRRLSGKRHEVITGVCLMNNLKKRSFFTSTLVHFKDLREEEMLYYIENYQPFDKAGAYGIQEWIGHIGITRIEGSYFNVVGLPVQRLYEELMEFVRE